MQPGGAPNGVIISEGILWIGDEAYPLRHISHVGKRVVKVNKWAVWRRFLLYVAVILLASGMLSFASEVFATIAMVVGLALATLQLVMWLTNKPPLYGLAVDTAGSQSHDIWTSVEGEITWLVGEIVKGLKFPDEAQMVLNVQHAVSGDLIQQYGPGSIGKATHHGAGQITGSQG